MQPLSLRTAQAGPVQIHYETTGGGEPLVLLHGLSGSTRWWRKNTDFLAEHFQLFLADLAGFGRGRGQRFRLDEAAQILLDWLDQLDLPAYNLMGHSMGGYIAADMAARAGERVRRLVLVDAAGVPFQRGLLRSTLALAESLPEVPTDFLPVLMRDALRAGPRTLARASLEVLASQLGNRLAEIQSETLIVWGEKDRLLPLEMGRRLHQALPRAQFLVIRGAGHNPMWDRPQQFNQAVLHFLQSEGPR
jgi:pimeloyl-ACP methyl ester carboxylesterase